MKITIIAAAIGLLIAPTTHASVVTVPTELNPGDQYRLAFVTSGTRTAYSSDIADYNDFVQDHADAVPELLSLGATWNAIVSTSSVDARDNTGTNPNLAEGVPIYLLNGTRLADDNADLWNVSRSREPLTIQEKVGSPPTNGNVWTGTRPQGVAWVGYELGSTRPEVGHRSSPDSLWIAAGSFPSDGMFQVYAVGSVLTVVPEPTTLLLGVMSSVGLLMRQRGATIFRG